MFSVEMSRSIDFCGGCHDIGAKCPYHQSSHMLGIINFFGATDAFIRNLIKNKTPLEIEKSNFLRDISWLCDNGEMGLFVSTIVENKKTIMDKCREEMIAEIAKSGISFNVYHQTPHTKTMFSTSEKMIEMFCKHLNIKLGGKGMDAHLMNTFKDMADIIISAHDIYVTHNKEGQDEKDSFAFVWEVIESVLIKELGNDLLASNSDTLARLKRHLELSVLATAYTDNGDGKLGQFSLIKDKEERKRSQNDFFIAWIAFVDLGHFFSDVNTVLEYLIKVILERKLLGDAVSITYAETNGAGNVKKATAIEVTHGGWDKIVNFLKQENEIMSNVSIPDIFPEETKQRLRIFLLTNLWQRKIPFNEICQNKGESNNWKNMTGYALELINAHLRGESNGDLPTYSDFLERQLSLAS